MHHVKFGYIHSYKTTCIKLEIVLLTNGGATCDMKIYYTVMFSENSSELLWPTVVILKYNSQLKPCYAMVDNGIKVYEIILRQNL